MTFQRAVIGLLIVIVAGLAGAFYIEWKMSVQVRTVKAFVEGHVFAEAVAACEKAPSRRRSNGNWNQDFRHRLEFRQARQIHRRRKLHVGR